MFELKFRMAHEGRLYRFAFNDITFSVLSDLIKGGVVEQYTGLCDRNGEEIYEGDIVRCKGSAQSPYDDSDPNLRTVKRDPNTHQLGLFGDVTDKYQASGFGLSETTNKRWTVIGNIRDGVKK